MDPDPQCQLRYYDSSNFSELLLSCIVVKPGGIITEVAGITAANCDSLWY